MTIEPAQGREAARDAGGRQPARAQALEPGHDVLGRARASRREPARAEKAEEVVEVSAIRRESISGGSALALESPEILGDRLHQRRLASGGGGRLAGADRARYEECTRDYINGDDATATPRAAWRARGSRRARWRPGRPPRRRAIVTASQAASGASPPAGATHSRARTRAPAARTRPACARRRSPGPGHPVDRSLAELPTTGRTGSRKRRSTTRRARPACPIGRMRVTAATRLTAIASAPEPHGDARPSDRVEGLRGDPRAGEAHQADGVPDQRDRGGRGVLGPEPAALEEHARDRRAQQHEADGGGDRHVHRQAQGEVERAGHAGACRRRRPGGPSPAATPRRARCRRSPAGTPSRDRRSRETRSSRPAAARPAAC